MFWILKIFCFVKRKELSIRMARATTRQGLQMVIQLEDYNGFKDGFLARNVPCSRYGIY